jgi:hypothetical protein
LWKDIGAQLKFPDILADGTPGFGQTGQQADLFVRADQSVEDHIRQGVVRRLVVEMRVKAGDGRADRHGQALRPGSGWQAGQRGNGDDGFEQDGLPTLV